MNFRSNRGEIVTVVVLVLALAGGAGLLAGWHPLDWARKKPDTAGLTDLQAKHEAARMAEAEAQRVAAEAQTAKDKATADERAKHDLEIRAAQEASEGAAYILQKIPADKQSAESRLGTSMVLRSNRRLDVAVGKLPDDLRNEIVQLMDGLITERDDAKAKLAALDRQFTELAGKHEVAVKVLATTTTELAEAHSRVAILAVAETEAQGKVTVATNQIKDIARKLSDERSVSSSAFAAVERWFWWACWLGGAWVFIVCILPGIVKVMPDGSALKSVLRDISGLCSNPILHWDARTKITELKRASQAPWPTSTSPTPIP